MVDRLDSPGGECSQPAKAGPELRIGILLWPKFPLLSLAGLCDALRHAADVGDQSRPVRCSWTILGLPNTTVDASCGVEIPVQAPFSLDRSFDYIAVIGGLLTAMHQADLRYAAFVREAASRGIPLLGICTGSFVLARLGLMKGRSACVHPYHVDDWQQTFPEVSYATNCHYVIDGDRITCAGGISIVEMMAELIRMHCGSDRAAKVVHQMTVNEASARSHISRRHALGYDSADHEKLRKAVILMEKNLATPLEISVIARLVDSSSRQLERVFLSETGKTPSEYYRIARLKYAKWLLTTTDLPIVTIAFESGFSDASHLIRHFQQLFGVAPGRLRKALQLPSPTA